VNIYTCNKNETHGFLQVCKSVGGGGETDAVGHSRTRAVPFHDSCLLQRFSLCLAQPPYMLSYLLYLKLPDVISLLKLD
jgi:hypothetical protein